MKLNSNRRDTEMDLSATMAISPVPSVYSNCAHPGSPGGLSHHIELPSLTKPPLIRYSEHLLQPNGSISGRQVAISILPHIENIPSAIPESHRHALSSSDESRIPLSHSEIKSFIESIGDFLHHDLRIGRGHRVAVVLPNGPELALAILAFTSFCSCVPLNAHSATNELESDLLKANIDMIVGLHSSIAMNSDLADLATSLNIPFTGLIPDMTRAGIFRLIAPPNPVFQIPKSRGDGSTSEADRSAGNDTPTNQKHKQFFVPNQHHDEVLVLFTSGTTGSKKLVPHLLQDVLIATACISVSWKLEPSDTNCNLMPLFHVGGIIRQVFSPILSGGCVICCPSFDPVLFWQLRPRFNWYYAAPTMHQLILQTGHAEGYLERNDQWPKLRMIANAAGGLLPSLARELREAFGGANILPSYGMTECMPITSPPANYQLEKPGTSGVAVGPEVAILNMESWMPVDPGKEGAICVRGDPCFKGYGMLAGSNEQPDTFLKDGWFNTGDLGYMDSDGYLYITGRSKEVINRGGEIISPLEVEEAVLSHPAVTACVAFSTQHSVLQEVVGIILVPAKNMPRIDLPSLHEYLGEGRLAAPKWPQCIVYMDAVPKSFTNKVLRVRLGKRLGLPELNDNMYWIERTFQATCPPIGAPVSMAIPCKRVTVSPVNVQRVLRETHNDVVVVPHPTRIGALVAYVSRDVDRLAVIKIAQQKLDAYAVPTHVCICYSGQPSQILQLDEDLLQPPQPSDAIGSILQEECRKGLGPADPLVLELQELMQVLLDLDCLPSPETSFFNLGGSSMLASQLASKIRKQHNIPFGGAEVFHSPSCNAIANVIRERRGETNPPGSENASETTSKPPSMAASSLISLKLDLTKTPFEAGRIETQPGCSSHILQLIPLFVIYPLWMTIRYFMFFRFLLWALHKVPGEKHILKFAVTLFLFHNFWVTISPLFFVVCKWLIIGKYRKGRYPIWGEYYLRWWFVDVLRKMIGRGIWGSSPELLNIYYRLLGAKIGKNASISAQAEIAEFDLVTIEENAKVEFSTVRGFGVDNGCMILGPVGVGRNASVGARSVVAPFTSIPDDAHLGPASSSYEISAAIEPNVAIEHLRYNRQAFAAPNFFSQFFVVNPICFLVSTFSHLPAFFVLYSMLSMPWHHNEPFETIGDLMEWLADPRRIPFFIGIRIVRALFAPFFYMFAAILVKKCIIGKFYPGPRDTTSQWQLIRYELAATLFSRENMQDVTEIIGRHHHLVSALYRILGAKVGHRVFWPGRQPVFTGEFELLEIGDDVVFGSRASIFCTTVDSSEKIILCAGSNVSDNTVVLPGSILGKGAVLGSNSLCPAGRYLPESSVWLGARDGQPVLLEKGAENTDRPIQATEVDCTKLQMHGDESTLRPFGKAVYLRQATYFVFPVFFIIIFTVITRIFLATLATLPILGAVHLAAGYLYGFPFDQRQYVFTNVSASTLFTVVFCCFMISHGVHVMIWLFVEVASKWGFMGRRQPGRFNWDTSDYCQRWELYQITNRVRELSRMTFLDFITGSPFMSTFFRLLGCQIGSHACLYPTGGDPYMPEPDLVEIGNRCVIDCASMVCHLNTRGNFELAKITMQNNCTLRTKSRIQQAVHMETGSMLLEKSLAMTGEVIESDSVWWGAPAARLLSYDTSSIGTRPSGSYAGSQQGDRYNEIV